MTLRTDEPEAFEADLLGEVTIRGVDLERREKSIMALLLLAGSDSVVSRDTLLEWLWDSSAGNTTTLSSYIGKLRTKLRNAFHDTVSLTARSRGLVLTIPDNGRVDYHRFREHRDAALHAERRGELEHALAEAELALAEWKNEPLIGIGHADPSAKLTNQRTELRGQWQAACQLHVRLLSLLGKYTEARDAVDQALVRWPDSADFTDLTAQLGHVTAGHPAVEVRGEARSTREGAPVAPFMAPPVPQHFVARRREGTELVTSLLAAADQDQTALGHVSAGVHGTGGYGKTTLAAWACAHLDVRARFPDGVLWVDLGRETSDQKIVDVLRDLIALLTGEQPPQFATVATAAERFAAALGERRVLLVVDDVWRSSDLTPFLRGGRRCVRLMTTRLPGLLPPNVTPIPVDRMAAGEGMELLRAGLPVTDNAVLMPLFERSGRWPLALRLLNGLLRTVTTSDTDIPVLVADISAELDRQGLELLDEYQDPQMRTAAVTLAMSLDAIREQPRHGRRSVDRFLMLAAFPDDMHIPYRQLELLWTATSLDVRRECAFFIDHSLLAVRDSSGVRLHDVLRDLLRHRWGENVRRASSQLVAEMRKFWTADGWHSLPEDRAGFLDTLTHHLVQCGGADEVDSVTTDLRFLVERVWRSGPSALLTEVAHRRLARCPELFTEGLADVVRSEAHLLVSRLDRADLAATLFSRCHGRVATRDTINGADALLRNAFVPLFAFPDLPDPRLDRILTCGQSPALTTCWRGDGHVLAVGDEVGAIYLHRVDDATRGLGDRGPTSVVQAADSAITGLSWSPDLLLLAAGTERGELIVVDPGVGSVLQRSTIEKNGRTGSTQVCFSPDSSKVLVVAEWGVVVVPVAAPGEFVSMPFTGSSPAAGDWHAMGGIAIQLADGRVAVWSGEDGDVPVAVNATNPVATGALAWHPNGTLIAVVGGSGLITLLDVATRVVTRVDAGRSWIGAVTWLADGQILITGDTDGVVRIWSVVAQGSTTYDLQESESLPGRAVLVRAFAADERASRLAVAQRKSSVRIWQVTGDLRQHASVRPWRPPGPGHDSADGFWARVNSVRWSPDGALIAAGSATGAVLLFALDGRRIRQTQDPGERTFTPPAWFEWSGTSLDISSGEVRSVAWAPDACGLLTVDDGGSVTLIDFDRGERRLIARDVSWENGQVAWSADGQSAAVGGLDNVQLWRTDSWQVADRVRVAGHVAGMAFSPTGGELAVAADTNLYLIRLRDRAVRTIGGHEMGISGIRWSANVLACCGLDGTVSAYTPPGQLEHVFTGDRSAVLDVDVSADGEQVVAVTMNGSIMCWQRSTGRYTSGLAVDSPLLTCSLAPVCDQLVVGGAAGLYALTRYG